jgi:hypothetical protein
MPPAAPPTAQPPAQPAVQAPAQAPAESLGARLLRAFGNRRAGAARPNSPAQSQILGPRVSRSIKQSALDRTVDEDAAVVETADLPAGDDENPRESGLG